MKIIDIKITDGGPPIKEQTQIVCLCPAACRDTDYKDPGNDCKWTAVMTYGQYQNGHGAREREKHLKESPECKNFLTIREIHTQ